MTPSEARGLAAAISCWLAYRDLVGMRSSLYEALTLVPITEYLARSWSFETELSYRKLFNDDQLPDQYADLVATKRSGSKKIVIETKILRSKISRSIVSDIYRLAAASGDVARYFLLSGRTSQFGECETGICPENASLFDRLFRYSYDEGFYLPPPSGSETTLPIGLFAPKTIYLRRCAEESAPSSDKEFYKTIIWSVGSRSGAAK
ncbi:MAG: hypothetical protein ACO1NY_15180 [Pseudorhodoplanes sp.]